MRGWDGWMALLTQWPWVWASSGSWWWTGKPGVLQSMGSQRGRHKWATELNWMSPGGLVSKESACKVGDPSSILGLGRSPGGGHGNPLQYSFLENFLDRGACTVHGVTKSQTQLSDQYTQSAQLVWWNFIYKNRQATGFDPGTVVCQLLIKMMDIWLFTI